jgi:hypothetical protein
VSSFNSLYKSCNFHCRNNRLPYRLLAFETIFFLVCKRTNEVSFISCFIVSLKEYSNLAFSYQIIFSSNFYTRQKLLKFFIKRTYSHLDWTWNYLLTPFFLIFTEDFFKYSRHYNQQNRN